MKELIGPFIDDEFLALGIVLVVAAAWLVQRSAASAPLSGAVQLLGCLGVLIISSLNGA
jgi:hypothetical protein